MLLRREDHHNSSPLHLRRLLELGEFFQLLRESLDEFVAFVDVGVFAAAEDDAEDHLVLLGQEFFGAVDLGHQVVVADLRAHAEFFVLAVVRVAFVLPLLLLVLEFAVIHDAANGRLLLGRDFNEVEADFAGTRKGVDGFEDTENFTFMSDDADGRDADLFVDPLRLTIEGYGTGSYRVGETASRVRVNELEARGRCEDLLTYVCTHHFKILALENAFVNWMGRI